MAFAVMAYTGRFGEYQDWIVGVAQKEEAAQAAVARLTEVAKKHRVSMPERVPSGYRLSYDRLDPAIAALKEAGDPASERIDCFTGVKYEYEAVQSFD
jgi:hypothetical protein